MRQTRQTVLATAKADLSNNTLLRGGTYTDADIDQLVDAAMKAAYKAIYNANYQDGDFPDADIL